MFAQNPNGALRGEIQDVSGARVSNAHVTVKSIGSSVSRDAVANDEHLCIADRCGFRVDQARAEADYAAVAIGDQQLINCQYAPILSECPLCALANHKPRRARLICYVERTTRNLNGADGV